jgi:hypothetical protein
MNKSELPTDPDLTIPAIPVVCDECRAKGMAGDGRFAGVPDILDFDPVPRRARSDGWKPEHQRAFIAALAITGSPRQAARIVGKHEFGAQTLRTARGGRGFAAAWEAAEDIYREREHMRIHANLAELADHAANSSEPFEGRGAGAEDDDYDDPSRRPDIKEITARLEKALEAIQRQYLRKLAPDPEKRHAFEVLNGPVDWDNLGGWTLSKQYGDREGTGDELE